jgi:hypothetical protein
MQGAGFEPARGCESCAFFCSVWTVLPAWVDYAALDRDLEWQRATEHL